MKYLLAITLFVFVSISAISQPVTGYYNGTEGKDREALKGAIHNIIKNHKAYSYTDAWSILRDSDKDPENSENVILVYTGRSQDKDHRDRGSDYDYAANGYTLEDSYNREHVWAKSHGDFGTETGVGSDVHNLKPVDRTVNSSRSYKDYDNGGSAHSEAVDCFSDIDSWEPRDEVKGDIARIILYMDTRYEGTDGELNLTAVDEVNTFPNPQHGKLSTLLEWHKMDPPDEFEMNRNNIIYTWQKNRNPFIDNPEFVDLIWGNAVAKDILIGNITMDPVTPEPFQSITINADITADTEILEVRINYGTTIAQVSSTVMGGPGEDTYSGSLEGWPAGDKIYYSIIARTATDTAMSVIYSFTIVTPFSGTITTIKEIQGEENASPYVGEEISTSGVVTGVFGTSFYIQDGSGPWSGVYIYDSGYSPSRGDSVILTGEIDEYYELTEIKNISFFQIVSSNNSMPDPILIQTSDLTVGTTTAEQYESVIVRVENAVHLRDTLYGMWFVDDGSGECLIHNSTTFQYQASVGNVYNIRGIATFTYDENKIDIRDEDDIEEAPDVLAPSITSIVVPTANTIEITFNEDVDYATSTDLTNYSLSDDIEIVSILQHSIQHNKIFITTAGMVEGDHSITIANVEDIIGNAMVSQVFEFNSPFTSIVELASQFIVFPNPAKDQITIVSSIIPERIKILNITGQIVFETIEDATTSSIDISNLEVGMYLLKIEIHDESVYKKIIIH